MERGRSAGAKGAAQEDGGLVPAAWLAGLFSGVAAAQGKEALLALWDGVVIRGDRHLGLFLSAALLLRHKTELLALQGPALRARLEALVSGPGTGPGSGSGERGGAPSTGEWLEEADRLERLTPVSFRVHLTALEGAALAATDRALARLSLSRSAGQPHAAEGQHAPHTTPTPPQMPRPPASSSSPTTPAGRRAHGMEVRNYDRQPRSPSVHPASCSGPTYILN